MSWSVTYIGTTTNVARALNEFAEKLDGQSKIEYESALPHLVALVLENFELEVDPVVKISASGHGYAVNGVQNQRTFSLTIERVYGQIV